MEQIVSQSRPLARRVLGQGALLFSGFALAQAFALARNALIGYGLSKGDFGIAAVIMLVLQLTETLSDLGADRLIVQADDGDDPRLMNTAHATLIARGVMTATAIYLGAGPIAQFFALSHAQWAFEVAAIYPLIKGFVHLDSRRLQRRLDNRSYLAVEIAPQAIALALTMPMLLLTRGYVAAVALAIAQGALAAAASHAAAERPYAVTLDAEVLKRLARFGWPIWLSALPLIAVYQGDRVIVGRLYGMEALAGYSAAFMMTMVPGLIAAKIGHALTLPLLAEHKTRPPVFAARYRMIGEATVLMAAAYLTLFVLTGETLLPLAFGPNYAGLGPVVAWLAAMWALRMVQAVPGMALMALGQTRPLLVAGIIRALALVPVLLAAHLGAGLAGIAAAGAIGEFGSLVYVAFRVERHAPNLARPFLIRTAFLLPCGAIAFTVHAVTQHGGGLLASAITASAIAAAALIGGVLLMPGLRKYLAGASA